MSLLCGTVGCSVNMSFSLLLSCKSELLTVHKRYAITMAFRWLADGGLQQLADLVLGTKPS